MKYIGSKSRIAKELIEIIKPYNYNYYIEPFVGGANMIDKVNCETRVGFDSNKYLIALLNQLKTDWKPPYISREEYEHIRLNKNSYPDYMVGYAGFAVSYCGKWFGGYAGRTITKNLTKRDYQEEAIRNLEKQREGIRSVKFFQRDFSNIPDFPSNSVVYCDPPYAESTKYKDKFDSVKFWNWVRERSIKTKIFVSEYSAPEDFEIVWEKQVSSSLSSNGISGENKISVEKLFVWRG